MTYERQFRLFSFIGADATPPTSPFPSPVIHRERSARLACVRLTRRVYRVCVYVLTSQTARHRSVEPWTSISSPVGTPRSGSRPRAQSLPSPHHHGCRARDIIHAYIHPSTPLAALSCSVSRLVPIPLCLSLPPFPSS